MKTRDYPEQIRLGSTVEFGMSVVIKGMQDFFERYPNIHIDFTLSHNLLKPLLDDELDIIVDCKPHIRPELKTIMLFQEEYAVIASPEYIKTRHIQKIEDLGRCNFACDLQVRT
ncbi:MAG: LysR substrate-binding domain-containing protein [Thermodesulfobacteriota bacterium]|nr:LysR substrate-binding domain-containing protein [Thermodesulfobacteriota bacterium]